MKVKCDCGEEKFIQEVSYIALEQVEIDNDNGNFNIISNDMIGLKNNPEHFNNFKCSKCMKNYILTIKDGKKEFWGVE
jgi:hypothetical protein